LSADVQVNSNDLTIKYLNASHQQRACDNLTKQDRQTH